jgi:hypothetical protein
MDPRLVPLNGVVALLSPGVGEAWPNELARQGYRLHLLEGDVQSDPQRIRADVIAYRIDPDVILLIECKSGRSVRPAQARAYLNAQPDGLRRFGTQPKALWNSEEISIIPIFAGTDEAGEALAESMKGEGIESPLLLVGSGGATLRGSTHPALTDFDIREVGLGGPPGRILVDHESPVAEIRELLVQEIAAAMARDEEALDLRDAGREIHPYWAQVAKPAQDQLVRNLAEAARSLEAGEMGSDIEFQSSNAISPRVVFKAQPARADPRGAPQAWQGLARHAASSIGRKARPPLEGQMSISFDDVADEAVPQKNDPEAEDPGENGRESGDE